MSRLLNALLEISKIESGAIIPEPTDFKVAAIFEELRMEFAGIADEQRPAARRSTTATKLPIATRRWCNRS